MTRYAADTQVSSEKSIMEIRHILSRYGADAFMFGEDAAVHKAVISFKFRGKFFKLDVPLPDKKARDITHTPSRGQLRSPQAQEEAYEQAVRQRWRAVALLVKALLEATESGLDALAERIMQSLILLPGQVPGIIQNQPKLTNCERLTRTHRGQKGQPINPWPAPYSSLRAGLVLSHPIRDSNPSSLAHRMSWGTLLIFKTSQILRR